MSASVNCIWSAAVKLNFFRRRRLPAKYAALNYFGTNNLGDEIQTIAALRFLPRVDAWADRDQLSAFLSDTTHKIILNGWFLRRPEHWPPSRCLHPLIVSFHLTRRVSDLNFSKVAPSSTVLGPKGIRYLKNHEPIGARDLDTLEQLRAAGVRAYFSGCLTLTLRAPHSPRRGEIYAVDVSDEVFAFLACHSDVPITRLTHADHDLTGQARFDRAAWLLAHYSSAKAVVTGRLHCALPCLALGTPVLFVESADDPYRFHGLRDLLRHVSEPQLLEGRYQFDLRSPTPNGNDWCVLRDQLEERCKCFIQEE